MRKFLRILRWFFVVLSAFAVILTAYVAIVTRDKEAFWFMIATMLTLGMWLLHPPEACK